jgi:hypothetical protein
MTLYISQAINSETMFCVWISGVYCTFCGVYVIMPTITAKCFGQKYFTMTYGLMYTGGFISALTVAFLGSLINKVGWFGLFSTISGATFISKVIFQFLKKNHNLEFQIGWILTILFYVKKSNGNDL